VSGWLRKGFCLARAIPRNTRGDLVGVVWGGGSAGPRGSADGADISDWLGRIVRAVWQRVVMHFGGV
jgi:hypothetical protein